MPSRIAIPYRAVVLRSWQVTLQSPALWLVGVLTTLSVGVANLRHPVQTTLRTLLDIVPSYVALALLAIALIVLGTLAHGMIILSLGQKFRHSPVSLGETFHAAWRRLGRMLTLHIVISVAVSVVLLLALVLDHALSQIEPALAAAALRGVTYLAAVALLVITSILSFFSRQEIMLYDRGAFDALTTAAQRLRAYAHSSAVMFGIDVLFRLVFLVCLGSLFVLMVIRRDLALYVIPPVLLALGIRATLSYGLWVLYYELLHSR